MDELDQTEWNPLAKKICDLLVGQQRRISDAAYDVNSSYRTNDGVQAFRLERKATIQLLGEWVGPEVGKEFEGLPMKVLEQHPSVLLMDYQRRGWAKEEIENHAAFLRALIKRIRLARLEFDGTRIRNDRRVILQVFFERNETPEADTSLRILLEEFGFDISILSSHLEYLSDHGLMRKNANHQEVVTQAGVKELKKMESEVPETLEQKRFRVLKTLYDIAPNDKHGMVVIFELAKQLGMNVQETNRILLYWEQKGMVSYPANEAVTLTPAAIDELEEKINHPTKPTQHFPSTITYIDNSVNIDGGVTGNVIGGQGNTYNTITNESITAILPKLAEFIAEIRTTQFPERHEVVRDLEKVYEVAQQGKISVEIWELLQAKIRSAEAVMKVAGIAYKTYTHWPVIADFFYRHWQ